MTTKKKSGTSGRAAERVQIIKKALSEQQLLVPITTTLQVNYRQSLLTISQNGEKKMQVMGNRVEKEESQIYTNYR